MRYVKMMLLWPMSLLYRAVTGLRNHLYHIQYKKTIGFTPFIIDVGNLSVGGTGKSPMIEYLIDWLQPHYPLAVLSRGYRRQTQGFRLATPQDTAATLGDEPFQFYRKYSSQPGVVVAVGEDRVAAVPEILMQHPDTQVILLDDAFQHRAIAADLHIMLTTYQHPFYQDHLLPLGRLREARSGVRRADTVIVTKCPAGLSEAEQQAMRSKVWQYARQELPVFFTGIRYGVPAPVFPATVSEQPAPAHPRFVLFSGLAHSAVLEDFVRSRYEVLRSISFGDHHRYSQKDMEKLVQAARQSGPEVALLTTEKDMVKLLEDPAGAVGKQVPLFYLPIQTYFLHGEEVFKDTVLRFMEQHDQAQGTNRVS